MTALGEEQDSPGHVLRLPMRRAESASPAGTRPRLPEEHRSRSHAVDAHLGRPLQGERVIERGQSRLGRRRSGRSPSTPARPQTSSSVTTSSPGTRAGAAAPPASGEGPTRLVATGSETGARELVPKAPSRIGRIAHQADRDRPARARRRGRFFSGSSPGRPGQRRAAEHRAVSSASLRRCGSGRHPRPGAMSSKRDGASDALGGSGDQRLHPGRIRSLLPPRWGRRTSRASRSRGAGGRAVARRGDPHLQRAAAAPAARARALGEFLELCFADRRLLESCGELRLYSRIRLRNMPPTRWRACRRRGAPKDAEQFRQAIREPCQTPCWKARAGRRALPRSARGLHRRPAAALARVAWRALIDERELRPYALSASSRGRGLDAPAKQAPPRKPQLRPTSRSFGRSWRCAQGRRTAPRRSATPPLREQLATQGGHRRRSSPSLTSVRALPGPGELTAHRRRLRG